ncbi:LPS-assembly protein LptD [Pseudomonas sp. CBSPBW29]|uniref:LPS-assembly protein LptD n=1 Tax=Pseudomonas TaxID=286 RepID=UPI0021AD1011|nr:MULTISPECIES: LPS-assembly protein LptD [unclassified Pseudomonas]WEL41115.1 LPS-assembly protein LptD [Pseudomonas sp. CBSPBW29]WEL62173.1 LPS-assembly protein LptD [Pseudomonas sp. CBSPGW29]WEL71358.1 LPS-assembly protein LptD [Pseudomonas sp. CBSPCGW29]WEL78272.1 LPS-assembly protein LptD [Pseudomonas sp. CBSPAW29]WEL83088.1 LPS-assembly protein LptD [Pseudomonas sp. CBSPCAW29]WEL85962.1 LPS-assembly protein LptD [Pseudomonas sp. CBSPCBW29]
MALKSPAFRRKFPLLVTGSLLAMQPFATSFVVAAEQYDCSVSASGAWDCAPKTAAAPLPPRPVHDGSAVSSANGTPQGESGGSAEAVPQTTLVTEAKGRGLRSRSADYSHLDWVPREKLTAAQLAETGPYCSGAYIEPIRPGMNDKTNKSDAPTFIGAKVSRYEQEQQVASLAGDVVMRQGSMQVEADEANLYQAENRGELNGNVRLRDNGALLVGDHAEVQLDTGAAKVDNAEYVMHKSRIRGNALYAKRAENAIIRLKDGTYTTCEPNSNAWQLKGNNITLNPATGFGTATNVTLRVKDIPILYTPYIYFPIDNRRQSGFLPPSFSTGSETGFTLVTPYYFNLAPNYDATLYPQYMTKRGLLMEGEFRYLTKSSEGQFGGAYLNDDSDERSKQTDYEKTRYMLNWQHKGGLDTRVLTKVDYTNISDPYYFQDLKSYQEGIKTQDYVNQQGSVTYRGDTYQAALNLQAYQLATISQITPYNRLPQLTFNGTLPYHPGGLNFAYETEAVRFDRDLESGTFKDENGDTSARLDTLVAGLTRANGTRLTAAPNVSLPLEWSYGFLTPKLKYVYTKYDLDLDSQGKDDLVTNRMGASALGETFKSSQSRAVPIASIDSGLYFDRNTDWFGKPYRQTLEPRLFYLYVPEKDQTDIPVFDTAETAFSYASLFRDNRFVGGDRIGDENKLSLGVTSRWIEENGFERQRVSIGQAIYFKDREVQLPGIDATTRDDAHENVSPIALDYSFRFNRDWRATADYNWDPTTHSPRSGSAMFHYQPEDNPNKVINVGYRYRNDQVVYNQLTGKWQFGGDFGTEGQPGFVKDYYKIQQHDFSMMWPIIPQWNLITRWQYDYARNRTLEAFGGFEYDNCCWKLRVINRYWVSNDEYSQIAPLNEKGDHGLFFQIVLKGLGGLTGAKVESFLDKGIEGYREREDQAF